jgi:hypothetical protein
MAFIRVIFAGKSDLEFFKASTVTIDAMQQLPGALMVEILLQYFIYQPGTSPAVVFFV